MVQENDLHRKSFLQLSARVAVGLAGILGLGGLARYFSHKMENGKPNSYQLGPAAEFPTSGKLVRPDIPAVIYKTAAGFQAFSLVCTHLGCTLEEDGDDFSCPCHGSQFGPEGSVLKGPAQESLPALKITVTEEGILVLETSEGWK